MVSLNYCWPMLAHVTYCANLLSNFRSPTGCSSPPTMHHVAETGESNAVSVLILRFLSFVLHSVICAKFVFYVSHVLILKKKRLSLEN